MPASLIQLLLLSLLVLLLLRGERRWRRRVRGVMVIVAVAALLFMSPIVLYRLVPLWQGADSDSCASSVDTVVVLPGGLVENDHSAHSWDQLTRGSLRRLSWAIARAQQSDARLVIPGTAIETAGMARLAQLEGIAASRVLTHDQADNTWLAAVWVGQQARQQSWGNIALVTSALHMRRARWSFEQNGVAVCSQPLPPDPAPLGAHRLLPDGGDIRQADRLIHELVGMVWYRMRYAR